MARCWLCAVTHKKAHGESWFNPYDITKGGVNTKRYCRDCYRMMEYYTWDHRWEFEPSRVMLKQTNVMIKPMKIVRNK